MPTTPPLEKRSAKNPGKKVVKKKTATGADTPPPEKKSAKKKTPPKVAATKKVVKKKTAPKKTPPHGTVDVPESPEVLYPEYEVRVLEGEEGLTAEAAKALLGWREEPDGETFGDDFLLVHEGVKIQCPHNNGNRELSLGIVENYVQDMIRRRWKLNGETISIGKRGMIVEGQHRLVALVLADSRNDNDDDPIMIDVTIVTGVEETDDVVNTINTGKVRSLSDVIFRSEIFGDCESKKRGKVAKVLDAATGFVQKRSGAEKIFGYRRTLSESLEFIKSHPRIVDAAKHIFEETDGNSFRLLSPGYSAGLLYLMASSLSDPEKYREKDAPDEGLLDFTNWDIASDFWTELISGAPMFEEVEKLIRQTVDETGASRDERIGILIKAWERYANKEVIDTDSLTLVYSKDEDGFKYLNEFPAIGGIDSGSGEETDSADVVEYDNEPEPEPEPEPPKKKAKKTKKEETKFVPDYGDTVTVHDDAGDPWEGTVVEIYKDKEEADIKASDNLNTYPGISWGTLSALNIK